MSPVGKKKKIFEHQNIYRTPSKYKTCKRLKSIFLQQEKSAQITHNSKKKRTHTSNPFAKYPQSDTKADIYTFNNIANLTKQDVDYLQHHHLEIYKKLQNYILNKHAQLYNHCMNISNPKNRTPIIVCFLYIFYTFFINIKYIFYIFFINIKDAIKNNTKATWYKLRTKWNNNANGTYNQPRCITYYPSVRAIMMICRSTCCDHITKKQCELTICSKDYFKTPKYVCLYCQQISCKIHYKNNVSNFVCDECKK